MNWDMPHHDIKRNSNYGMVKRKKMDSSTQNKKNLQSQDKAANKSSNFITKLIKLQNT